MKRLVIWEHSEKFSACVIGSEYEVSSSDYTEASVVLNMLNYEKALHQELFPSSRYLNNLITNARYKQRILCGFYQTTVIFTIILLTPK